MSPSPLCPVCDSAMADFDRAPVLNGKYEAVYHRCPACGLVAARDTPWLEEAYTHAIHDADSGLLRRARKVSRLTAAVIGFEGLRGGRFLDWAGGYGVFTEFMRERGADFWHHDDFAEPVFARKFVDDGTSHYDLITAFEVFEHLAEPRKELAHLAERTDYVFFSTELLPDPAPKVGEWWYYLPNVGQHITFHTPESLRRLGEHLGYQLTTNGTNWHMFHRRPLDVRTRMLLSSTLHGTGRRVRRKLREVLR